MNQTFSRFSLTILCAANNAKRCSKAPKETPIFGALPRPRDVWSVRSKLMHKGSAFMRGPLKRRAKLLNCLILSSCARAKLSVSNRPAALPEKDSLFQSFRRAFFKRPRTPLAYSPVSFSPSYFVSGEVKGALLSLNICAIVPSATRPSIMPLISLTSSSLPNANANA